MATAIRQPNLDSTTHYSAQSSRPSSKRILLGIVAAAFALRMIIVVLTFRDLTDPANHFERFGNEVGWIARSIVHHQGFSSPFFHLSGPTALLPPLYPYILAGIFKLFGLYSAKSALAILTFNGLCSALTCIPIYLAARLSINARVAAFAAWGWAIYPFSIYFSVGRVWEFSLTSLLITTCFYLALTLHRDRPLRWLGFGALYGLAGLSNPAVFSLAPVLLLLPIARLWMLRRVAGLGFFTGPFCGDIFRRALLAAFGLFLVLTPWTVRNYKVMHVLCPVRDCFWYEFWSANNGDDTNPTLAWTHPASNPDEMVLYQSQGEIQYIAHKQEIVKDFVAHNRAFFYRLTVRRILNYWTGFWSLDPSYRRQEPTQLPNVFFCSSLTLLMLVGGIGWWRRDPVAALPYLLSILLFPIAYYTTHPLMDYRQPIEPEVVILVVVGLRSVKSRITSRRVASCAISEAPVEELLCQIGDPSPAELSS
jgi:hypothetical protein